VLRHRDNSGGLGLASATAALQGAHYAVSTWKAKCQNSRLSPVGASAKLGQTKSDAKQFSLNRDASNRKAISYSVEDGYPINGWNGLSLFKQPHEPNRTYGKYNPQAGLQGKTCS
jgi:hypothetical protein